MTYPKLLGIITVFLFATIGIIAFFKGDKKTAVRNPPKQAVSTPIVVELEKEVRVIQSSSRPKQVAAAPITSQTMLPTTSTAPNKQVPEQIAATPAKKIDGEPLPDANRI